MISNPAGAEDETVSRSGFVVADLMVPALALMAVTGAAAERPALAALGATVIVVVLVARAWTRLALEDIEYRCVPSLARAVEGDELRVTLHIENRKALPVPWLSVREILPAGLELLGSDTALNPFTGGSDLEATLGIGPFERVRRRYRVRAVRRGEWTFGPVRLRAGDPFGFYETLHTRLRASSSMVIYPAVRPVPDTDWVMDRIDGDARRRRQLREDPTLPLALRSYRRGDRWRSIDWKATARRGVHVVRTYESAAARALVIVLDCHTTVSWPWSDATGILEACVRSAASIASRALDEGQEVGLVCNGIPRGARTRAAIGPGAGDTQRVLIMEALARAQCVMVEPLSRLVTDEAASAIPSGAAIVWVSGSWREETGLLVAGMRDRGHPGVVIYLGREPPVATPDLTVLHWARRMGASRR